MITNVPVTFFMLGAAAILFIGFLGRAIAKKTHIPYIVWLMAFGVLLGPVFGILKRSSLLGFAPFVSTVVIVLFLFNSGLNLNLHKIFRKLSDMSKLAFINFFTAAVIISAVMYLVGFSPLFSVLIGLAVGSISSVIIPSIRDEEKRSIKKENLANVESRITEPLGVALVLVLLSAMVLNSYPLSILVTTLSSEFSLGLVIGAIFALAWIPAMSYFQRFKYEYSYAASLALVFLLYTIVQDIGGSGPISALMFGMIIANGERIYKDFKYKHSASLSLSKESKSFDNLIIFFMTSFFFVYFGSIIIPNDYNSFLIGGIIALAAIISRQIGTKIALSKSKVTVEDRLLTSFMLSRGTGAAIIATLLLSFSITSQFNFVDIVFSVILLTIFSNGALLLAFRNRLNPSNR